MAVCHYHPERQGVGICMRCRVVICGDCCTRVEGINHCHACMQALGQREAPSNPMAAIGAGVAAVMFLGVAWGFFLILAWLVEGRLAP